MLSLHSLIYMIINISSHTPYPHFCRYTLCFTFYGVMITLVHDFHEKYVSS